MKRKIISLLTLLILSSSAFADDGLYVCRSDGSLGEPIADKINEAVLISLANYNSRFRLTLQRSKPFSKPYHEICLKTKEWVTRFIDEGNIEGEKYTIQADTYESDPALIEAIAKHFDIEPRMRRHPGHRFTAKFIPKDRYLLGDSVPVELEITNVGPAAFPVKHGGRNRGSRNNSFTFSTLHEVFPDIGNPRHLGGSSDFVNLKPGDSTRIPVDLKKWFSLDERNVYVLRGCYIFKIVDTSFEIFETLWDEYACDEFSIRINKG